MRRPGRAVGAAALLLTLCALTPGSAAAPRAAEPVRAGAAPARVAYPGRAWARADPEDMGFDADALAGKVEQAGLTGSSCFAVVRRGRLVGEWYWHGTDPAAPQPVFSITKSVASTLVGLAEADGLLDIDDRASEYIPVWRDTPSEDVTIRDLLSNTSGRHWDYLTDYPALTEAANADLLAAGLDQDDEPGTTWVYNNAAIQALDVVLQEALGGDVAAFADERLFTPVGMRNTRLTHDDDGNTRLNVGLESTCGDLARFGYLFLRGGAWRGEQVVPRRWVEEATGRPSQRLNDAYGLLWWLNRPGTVLGDGGTAPTDDPPTDGDKADAATGAATDGADAGDQMAPGAPEDMFWAVGMGDQVLQVDPGSQTVVVRLAPDDPDVGGGIYPVSLAADVLDALVSPSGRAASPR